MRNFPKAFLRVPGAQHNTSWDERSEKRRVVSPLGQREDHRGKSRLEAQMVRMEDRKDGESEVEDEVRTGLGSSCGTVDVSQAPPSPEGQQL